jgi:hypothetical protein
MGTNIGYWYMPQKQDNKNKYDGFEMLIEGDEE